MDDFFKEIMKLAVQGGGLKIGQFVEDNHGTINYYENSSSSTSKSLDTFPRTFDEEQGKRLFNGLKEKRFIDANTTQDNFLFIFGCTTTPPIKRKPISWLTSLESARYFIEDLCFEDMLAKGTIRKKDLNAITKKNFIHNDVSMGLNKPREEQSNRYALLQSIFSDLKKSET